MSGPENAHGAPPQGGSYADSSAWTGDENPEGGAGSPIDPDVVAFAGRMFGLARAGSTAELADMVDAGLPVNLTNDKGDTLLMLAAYHAHPDTVRALLERGADTERVNDRGQTPLGAAVFRQSLETVMLLLQAGADPDTGAPSAREMAAFFELPEMDRALREGARRREP